MPISLAHDIHKKRDPLSEYEKKLALADDDKRAVLACPFGCGEAGHPELDEFGLCDHVVGFTNCTRPDRSPTHMPDGEVKRPEGVMVDLLDTEADAAKRPWIKVKDSNGVISEVPDTCRDALRRRKMTKRQEPLRVGDYLVRVNGTSRRVYRQLTPTPAAEPAKTATPPTADKKTAAKVADAPPG